MSMLTVRKCTKGSKYSLSRIEFTRKVSYLQLIVKTKGIEDPGIHVDIEE